MASGGSLGTLSIDVIAEIADLVSDMGKVQQESAKAAQAFQQSFTGAIDSVTSSFQTLAGILGAGLSLEGIKSAVDDITGLDTKVASMSATFGISVGTFSDLNAAAVVAGGSLDDVTGAMNRLQKAAAGASAGNAQNIESFRALGISVQELNSLSPDQLLQRVAVALTETAPSAERTANMMALFGRNIAGVYPILQQLAQGAHDAAVAFGAIITPEAAAKSEAYSQSLGHVKLAAEGIGQAFVTEVLPALTQAANEFAGMISTSSSLQTVLHDAGVAAEFLADHLDGVVESAKTIGELALDLKFANMAASMNKVALSALTVDQAFSGVGTSAASGVALGIAAFDSWQLGAWARENFTWVAQIGNWIGGGVAAAQVSVVAAFGAIWAAVKASFQAFIATIESGLATPFDSLATKLQNIAPGLSIDFRNIANAIKPATDATDILAAGMASFSSIGATAAGALKNVFGSMSSDAKDAGAAVDAMNEFKATITQVDSEAAHGKLSNDEYENSLQALSAAYVAAKASGADADTINKLYSQTITILGSAVDVAADKQSTFTSNVKAGQAAMKAYQSDAQKLADLMDQIATGMSGPYLQAVKQYDTAEDLLNKTWADAVKAGTNTHELLLKLQADQDEIEKHYVQTTDAIRQQHDAFAKVNEDLGLQTQLLGVLPNYQAAVTAGAQAYDAALKAQVDLYGQAIPAGQNIGDVLSAQLPAYVAAKQAVNDLSQEVKNQDSVWKDWTGIATNALDSTFQDLDKDLIQGGSFMKDLVNIAQTVVEAILFEFEKLAIINPLLQRIFGTGVTGALPTLENSAIGQVFSSATGGSGGIMSSLFGGSGDSWVSNILGSTGGSGSGIMGFLFGGAGSYNMLGDSSGLLGMGASDALGAVPDYAGLAGDAGDFGSVLGTGGDATSGLLSSGGSVSGGLGALGSIAGGALAGWQLGSQLGGTAGGVIGAAGLATAAYFVPVVGWIAGALSLLNMATGGDVFGTSYKPTGVTGENITESGSGASISDYYQEHKHGALFSGGKYKNVTVAATGDQTNAIDSAFTQIQNTVDAAATALGENAGDIIAGSWTQSTDKTGKVIANTSTVLGQQYSDTAQQFFERVTADTEEAMLPASAALTKFYNSFQSNADQLADAANMLVQAQVDINKGMGLLGTTDTNLGDIGTEVQKLAQGSETLVQAYARLQAEQEDVSSTLTELGLQTNNTGTAFLEFADSMATAAGGLSNLQSLWSSYYSSYYNTTEQMFGSLSQAEQAAQTALSGIGENVGESMAQFRADFTAAMPNLTGAQVTQWLQAGQALAAFNTAVDNVANAVKQAEADASQLSATLFGTDIQQLQARIAQNQAMGFMDPQDIAALAAAQAAQGQQQQLSEATQLLEDLGNIGAVTGSSLQDFATEFHIPLDKLATMLGTNAAGLEKDFEQQEKAAAASMQIVNNTALTNQLLAAINVALGGTAINVPSSTPGTAVVVSPGSTTPPQRGILPTTPGTPPSSAPATSADVQAQTAAIQAQTAVMERAYRSNRSLITSRRGTRGTVTV